MRTRFGLMLRVRVHSSVIRTLLRQVYEVRAIVKKLIDVDTVLLNGKASDLRSLLVRIGQSESEEEQRLAVIAMREVAGSSDGCECAEGVVGRVDGEI